jgi:hypothetical protein
MIIIRKSNKLKPLAPAILLFVLLTAALAVGRTWLENKDVDVSVTMFGNLILVVLTLVSYRLMVRSLQSTNIHAFTRMMIVNFMVKFFVVLIVVLIYALTTKEVNQAAVIICVILYFTYTLIEKNALIKMLRSKNNA